jgi:hypothetical protein
MSYFIITEILYLLYLVYLVYLKFSVNIHINSVLLFLYNPNPIVNHTVGNPFLPLSNAKLTKTMFYGLSWELSTNQWSKNISIFSYYVHGRRKPYCKILKTHVNLKNRISVDTLIDSDFSHIRLVIRSI